MTIDRALRLFLAIFVGLSTTLGAQPAAATTTTASQITVTLVTFGQAEEVFERFGHDALWFHIPATREDVVFHWGQFDFEQPQFVARWVSGDTRYWMGGENAFAYIDNQRRTGRQVTLQRLELTPAQSHALYDFVRWNGLPENRFYRYDYFRDNCSTRLRDALDGALGGMLKARFDTAGTALTYRGESIRLTDAAPLVQLGIDLALGSPADRPLTAWQSFFIPMRMRDAIRGVNVYDAAGVPTPLVAEERVLPTLPGTRQSIELDRVPNLVPRYLLSGVVIALFVAFLRAMMVGRRAGAWALALVSAAWWLVCGILGVLIAYAWAATRHVFWAWNEHLLLLSPVCLLLVVLAPMSLIAGRAVTAARVMAILAGALGVLALLLALVPSGQPSGPVIALLLPVHLALAWALVTPRLTRPRSAMLSEGGSLPPEGGP